MSITVGQYVMQRMQEWGIERIYGYPGDGINGLLAGLRKNDDKPRFIQARHEELAAFMACAHAKFTGTVGVCIATSGPGAIHLLNGLYDAKMDHQPVVAIVGQSATTALGSQYQQEVDLQNLFKDVANEYCITVSSPAAVRHCVDRAFRIALDQKCVTCIIFPKDIQEETAVPEPPQRHDHALTGIGCPVPYMIPSDTDLHAAAKIFNEAKKVAVLVGQGAMNAQDEVLEITDRLGAGIAKSWLGKAVVAESVPYCTGHIGLLGSKPTWDMMRGCDALLVVGSSFPYAEFYPKVGQAKGVQIDIDGRLLSLRYPMDVNLKGDAKQTLKALIPLIQRKTDRAWQKEIIESVKDWWKVVEGRAHTSGNNNLLNPERIFWELSPKLPDDCIISADSGTTANWYARDLKIRRGMMASGSGNLATMGAAVPYAVGAKFCFPDRCCIAVTGDGAMQMNGLNACITVAKYWKEWSDPRWITLVLNNRDLNMVTWEQRIMMGDIRFLASQELPDFPYAAFADSIGLRGIRVEKPEQLADAWDRALNSDRPVIVEAISDPDTPTLPPHITLEQARHFTETILRGDPNEPGIIKQAIKGMVETFVPHHTEQ
ncbi:MAG TPA: thiamine pyrophosphate-requiring protein [Tepidisphaeraceae bacterium]|jgi:pyruvate dehydrogenase (quinone)|nr:thiamine pyrophosphate-requiring protein [Tepidisphaeraceae bacterium]